MPTPTLTKSSPEEAFARFSSTQIQQAGNRYTPGVDPSAPNLRIKDLFVAIDNAACGEAALQRFAEVNAHLQESVKRVEHCSQDRKALSSCLVALGDLPSNLISRFKIGDAGASVVWQTALQTIENLLGKDLAHWKLQESQLPPDTESYSPAHNTIRGNLHAVGRAIGIVQEELEYSSTPAFKVLYDPKLLLSGEWGTGKTHLMCDVTSERIRLGRPTVLVLAKNFKGDILQHVLDLITLSSNAAETLDQLSLLANQRGERGLIIIDGVNEGPRKEWRLAINTLLELTNSRPSLALIVTCRTPFEDIAVPSRTEFQQLQHRGFADQEFDAQAAFFEYYKLPFPEVPLLEDEFSRPLTLKLICLALRDLSGKKLRNGFAGIASGQKGMTFVLESFVKQVGRAIENDFGLAPNGCWQLLKGGHRVTEKRRSGFAACMAIALRGYVNQSEADRIVAANYPSFSPSTRKKVIEAFRVNGILDEDIVWYSSRRGAKSRVVYRLPYQRFSDHLIARHLLEAYLDVSSPSSIAASFRSKSPLGTIFRKRKYYGDQFSEPGLAQALISEYPERIGSRVPEERRELLFELPKSAHRMAAHFEPFVDGLFWRDPTSFTKATVRVINLYLNSGSRSWERVIDALAAISTKPRHPFHALRLYNYLAGFSMADRDLSWSEFVRRKYVCPTINRLLSWASGLQSAQMTEGVGEQLTVLLSLVLTTVNRRDRDVATRALVLIGEQFPAILFAHAERSLNFNDPYVPERMLAAAYGTTMSLVDSSGASAFRPILGSFARVLYETMFAPGAAHATNHTLMRDYALGVIQLAIRANCVSLPSDSSKNLLMPFPEIAKKFGGPAESPDNIEDELGHAIQMDFGNYTIGRLIPDRANYDNDHPEYRRVRAHIELRMLELGYSAARFKVADRELGRYYGSSEDDGKSDRYGKKYAWIAYFEMWGEREAQGALPDLRQGERTSDCGVDPSFPKRPPRWSAPIPDLFGDDAFDTSTWVAGGYTPDWRPILRVDNIDSAAGPWVLLNGFIRGEDKSRDRELFGFLRGLLVAPKDVEMLRSRFSAVPYPGNSQIPDGASEHYLFAGEAGRRGRYAANLLSDSGKYRRQTAEAFYEYITLPSAKRQRVKNISIRLFSPEGGEAGEELVFPLGPVPRTRRVPGIRVEIPMTHYSWESYHSALNAYSGFALPSASLLQRLSLASRDRETDFYDQSGRPGVVYRESGDGWKGNRFELLYIRADLLRTYLRQTRQTLVWCNWGERDWLDKMDGYSMRKMPGRNEIWQGNMHIHRSFASWKVSNLHNALSK